MVALVVVGAFMTVVVVAGEVMLGCRGWRVCGFGGGACYLHLFRKN